VFAGMLQVFDIGSQCPKVDKTFEPINDRRMSPNPKLMLSR
jgi:hypothetical protein